MSVRSDWNGRTRGATLETEPPLGILSTAGDQLALVVRQQRIEPADLGAEHSTHHLRHVQLPSL